jgi:CO/xanthine dehydrogenase Mo-binding subunit
MLMEPPESRQVTPSGEVVVWSGVQAVHRARQWLAEYFDLPQSKVRVISLKIGGGFGGKITLAGPIVVGLARKAGRPRQDRDDAGGDVHRDRRRRPGRMTVKTGVDGGWIVARQVRILWNSAVSESDPISSSLAALLAPGPYQIPQRPRGLVPRLHEHGFAPGFRGLGAPQVLWATGRTWTSSRKARPRSASSSGSATCSKQRCRALGEALHSVT